MARKTQEPEVTQETGPMEGRRYKHPAYAQIGASRVSGAAVLYGSDFKHQNFVRISIAKSELVRNLSNDWAFASSVPYIEIDLSEAQWATFVSSMNVGSGTKCTVRQLGGEIIPGLPDPESRKDQFHGEAGDMMAEALAELAALRAEVVESKMSQKQKDAILSKAQSVQQHITGNLAFVLDQFGEHMERTVEKAKIEINAYATNAVMHAGLNALTGGETASVPVLQFSGSKVDSNND